jgi:hypothetical protein
MHGLMILSEPQKGRDAPNWDAAISPLRGLPRRGRSYKTVESGAVTSVVSPAWLMDITFKSAVGRRQSKLQERKISTFSGSMDQIRRCDIMVPAEVAAVTWRCHLVLNGQWPEEAKGDWFPVAANDALNGAWDGWINVSL